MTDHIPGMTRCAIYTQKSRESTGEYSSCDAQFDACFNFRIYRVDGDMVKFCRAGMPDDPRPSEFKTKAGRSAFVSVYRRVKP